MSRDTIRILDRLARVRRVRARLAMAALGRSQTRVLAETALVERVAVLLAAGGATLGAAAADRLAARSSVDAMLGTLADSAGERLAGSEAERQRLAMAMRRAQAAVDAALARRAERERGE